MRTANPSICKALDTTPKLVSDLTLTNFVNNALPIGQSGLTLFNMNFVNNSFNEAIPNNFPVLSDTGI